MPEFDLVIRGGSVVDGTGIPKYTADVGIAGGRIREIGRIGAARAARVIDADGLIVAPGHIDLHTHYDAQIQWDPWCTISGWHGVTTVVLGNCGFGFAPVRPEDRDRAMLMMARTEAIGLGAMQQAMLWDWVTIPEWMDTLERIAKGVNCVTYAPIVPILNWVMGVEAAKKRSPTPEEQREIDALLDAAMEAGACGWSMQRTGTRSAHVDIDGTPMPTDTMAADDVLALGRVLARRGEGLIEIFQDSERGLRANLAFVERLAEASGRPILYNVVQAVAGRPDYHQRQLAWLEECNRRGLAIYGQGATVRQPFHVMLEDWNLYDMSAVWKQALLGTPETKKRNLRDAATRQAMIRDYDEGRIPVAMLGGPIEGWLIEGAMNAPTLDALLGRSVGEVAKERGVHPVACLLDLSLEAELQASFLTQSATGNDAAQMAELLASPYVVAGISDGGAHGKFTVGGAYGTDLLEWLVRDEGKLSVERAHQKLAWLPARVVGLRDRGAVIEGLAADLIVYDLARVKRAPDWMSAAIVHDLPGGEWRRVQKAEGYHYTLVGGEVTFEAGRCTGATPGALLRHGRAPTSAPAPR
jgi:N-acyl-D-aspartate/D-glutamate deacylase